MVITSVASSTSSSSSSSRMVVMMVMVMVMMTMTLLSGVWANIFSSSVKLQRLAHFEDALMSRLSEDVNNAAEDTAAVSYKKQVLEYRHKLKAAGAYDYLHPNSGHLLISAFINYWKYLINTSRSLQKVAEDMQAEQPTESDLEGTKASILRLQTVYNLSADQIFRGNYSGYLGPPLHLTDAYSIGSKAFSDGKMDQSTSWLQLGKTEIDTLLENKDTSYWGNDDLILSAASILCLQGRVAIRQGHKEWAKKLLQDASDLMQKVPHEKASNQQALEEELAYSQQLGRFFVKDYMNKVLSRLCRRNRTQVVESLRPYHTCRYKPSLLLPYRVYKEEILSLSPYASLFHDFVHDSEMEHIKETGSRNLIPALVLGDATESRSGDYSWLSDSESHVIARVSARIRDATWLLADDHNGADQASAERMQVVNYGIGGHYNVHHDFIMPTVNYETNSMYKTLRDVNLTDPNIRLRLSGNRMATFLVYLSDTDVGGHTAFTSIGVSVPPVKGQALFWYNLKTDGSKNNLTAHAGCPTLRGHKWICNKWIWSDDNMFRRPCGASPYTTQLELEALMYSRRRHTCFP